MIDTTLFAAVAAAIVFGGAVLLLPPASTEVILDVPQTAANEHRLTNRPLGRSCAEQTWPYYKSRCLRDARQPGGRASAIRIVSADRPPMGKVSPVVLQFALSNNQVLSSHE
jgi:hypothetical protein